MAFDTPTTVASTGWQSPQPVGSLLETFETQTPDLNAQGLEDPDKDKDAINIPITPSDKAGSLLENTKSEGTEDVPLEVGEDLLNVINALATEGTLDLFENREIKTVDDIRDLLTANINDKISLVNENIFQEQLSTLPPQFQSVMKYGLSGGQDVKTLLEQWGETERVFSIDVTTDEGKAEVVREYLTLSQYGTPEIINKDIETWKNLGTLDEKVDIFKPKLEQFHVEQIKSIENQARFQQEQEATYFNQYTEAVGQVLSQSDLNGLKLGNEVKQYVYENTQPIYQSQLTGKSIDGLQAVIEELKFGQNANPALYSELLLFATQPQLYREILANQLKESIAISKESTLRKKVASEAKGNIDIPVPKGNQRQNDNQRW